MNLKDIMKVHRSKEPPIKVPIINNEDKKLQKQLQKKGSTLMFRTEEIEQTNTIIHLKWKLKDFVPRRIYFKLQRSRSLGEYVTFYSSQIMKGDPHGVEWPSIDFRMKDICQNDANRSLRIEVYEYERKPDETEFTTYVAHFDFTLNFMKRHINQYMSCYNGEF